MKIPRTNLFAFSLLLTALAVSAYLLHRSFALVADGGGADVCSTVLGKTCDDTLNHPRSRLLGTPLAGWGVLYFLAMLLLLGRGAGKILSVIGGLGSLGLLGLLLFGDVPFCPLCLVVNTLNLVAVVPALRWQGEGLLRPPAATYGITLALCGGLHAWIFMNYNPPAPKKSETVARYEATAPVEIELSADDPVLGPASAKAHLVVFSDALCPHCKRFWDMLKDVTGNYGDDVRITFKHFPLDSACNPSIKETKHPHACTAARALEAARVQGAFWKYDEALKGPSKPGRKKTFGNVAEDVGLDVERFRADMNATNGLERIQKDIAIGIRLGLTETPAVFVNGRRVRPPSPEVLRQVLDHVTGR